MPTLSRAGCNQGSCHGNSEGRGGLKLSLRGDIPEADYLLFTRAGGGRRVDRSEPGRSLILLKGAAVLPHGGGARFSTSSPEFRVVARWIAEGARFDAAGAPQLVRIEATPREQVVMAPVTRAQIRTTAVFSDGSRRDVSHLASYNPGDPRVEVTPVGLAQARPGLDTAVLVRYAGEMASVRLTFVEKRTGYVWNPVPAVNWVDDLQYARLRELRLLPSPLTTDVEFVRRAYLDTLGLLPTPEEARAFQTDPRPDRRARLIDALLERPEFDENWTLKWSDLLRLEERTLDPRGNLAYRDWIRAGFANRKPMDQFARELLTATGSTYLNPPANYYRRTRDPIELGETTAQVFLGSRLLCAKCHNHPTERWKQDDYYAIAALFARIDRKLDDRGKRDRFDKHERNGEEEISVAVAGRVEHPRTGQAVAPRLPLALEPLAADTPDPRVRFAEWLTAPDNPFFARAMVNRIWQALFTRGLVDPVDDLRDSNPASNPKLLDALARDFVRAGFDLRHTVRLLMNSRTYQLSAEPNATNRDDERFFSRALPQRLPAETLLDAITQITEATDRAGRQPGYVRAALLPAINKYRHPFLKLFGQPARESVCACERNDDTTLGQAFALISGDLLAGRLAQPDNRVGRLMRAGRSDTEIVQDFYLSTVAREPSSGERERALSYLAGKPDRRAALEDLLWALLNSKEFLLRR